MHNNNLPPGVTDGMIDDHFSPSLGQQRWEGLNQKEQLDLCLEYIDHIDGYQRFDEWAFERIKKEKPEWLIEYFEDMDGFMEWLGQDDGPEWEKD